jgi:hypothetical protein
VLDVAADGMWARDDTGIPTGRLVPVPAGPWDDAFTGLRTDPGLRWPGTLSVRLRSSCPVWVVYDQDPRLVCVEPQTDAPDAFNRDPTVLEPGERLEITMTIEWARLDPPDPAAVGRRYRPKCSSTSSARTGPMRAANRGLA